MIDLETNLNRFRGQLPAMNLQTHLYASEVEKRMVTINHHELKEGEWLNDLIQIREISPRYIVIYFDHQEIKVPALYEWAG